MKTKTETLNPGDPGYEEAFHKQPLEGKDGSVARLRSPLDAQREADEANNAAVAEAERTAAREAAKVPVKPGAAHAITDKKASQ